MMKFPLDLAGRLIHGDQLMNNGVGLVPDVGEGRDADREQGQEPGLDELFADRPRSPASSYCSRGVLSWSLAILPAGPEH